MYTNMLLKVKLTHIIWTYTVSYFRIFNIQRFPYTMIVHTLIDTDVCVYASWRTRRTHICWTSWSLALVQSATSACYVL